eukprot:1160089-Pelagomonas_calceolata.AAC.6
MMQGTLHSTLLNLALDVLPNSVIMGLQLQGRIWDLRMSVMLQGTLHSTLDLALLMFYFLGFQLASSSKITLEIIKCRLCCQRDTALNTVLDHAPDVVPIGCP